MQSRFLLPSIAVVLCAGTASAQQKLLLTEVVTSPTPAEYVEIYNPNPAAVDLSNYYLADYNTYYLVTTAAPTPPGTSDFVVRFPAGATIQPGEYQTISIGGAECFQNACGTGGTGKFNGYGVYPSYEIFSSTMNSNANVPDMLVPFTGAVGATRGLTNGYEPVILFYWDQTSPLVKDVDYVFYGGTSTSNPPVNKSGITVSGAMYLPDTADDPLHHAPLFVGTLDLTCRADLAETGQITAGGNGITGGDETSENWAVTWVACQTASPNAATIPPNTGGAGGAGGAGVGGAGGAGGVATGGAGGAGGTTSVGGAGGAGGVTTAAGGAATSSSSASSSSTSASSSAASSGSGVTGSTASTGGSSASGLVDDNGMAPETGGSSCGCRTIGSEGDAPLLALAPLALATALARRRRRKAARNG